MLSGNDSYSDDRPGGSPSEYDVVVRAQQGEQQAFEELYECYSHRITRYITCIINDSEVSNELTQETFLKAWEMLPGLHNPASFSSWLYRIATNKAYNHQKHARLIRLISWEENITEITMLSAIDPISKIDESEVVRLVLSCVALKYRSCLILYFIDKLPRQQIAELLEIKMSSIDKYIARGKEEFRQVYYQMLDHENASSKKMGKRSVQLTFQMLV